MYRIYQTIVNTEEYELPYPQEEVDAILSPEPKIYLLNEDDGIPKIVTRHNVVEITDPEMVAWLKIANEEVKKYLEDHNIPEGTDLREPRYTREAFEVNQIIERTFWEKQDEIDECREKELTNDYNPNKAHVIRIREITNQEELAEALKEVSNSQPTPNPSLWSFPGRIARKGYEHLSNFLARKPPPLSVSVGGG